ncbi:MAG: PspA/IM30 family protein [Candidatus Syntropharchaeia archaeon]
MGLLKRAEVVIKSKVNRLLDKFEDPRETLDYSYQKQLELLQQVKKSIATTITARKRLELQKVKLEKNVEKLESQAREAIKAGREDLARLALERKRQNEMEIESLSQQIEEQKREEEKLIETERKLSTKIEIFKTKKEVIKAKYSAAEAQVKVKEAVGGISEEMADVGFALQRAEEKAEEMIAKSQALDEMAEIGTIEEIGGEDDIERELKKIRLTSGVDEELERLKKEVKG